jgi:hypothetical protein
MGYRKLSARPRHHAQAEGAIEDLKKLPRPSGRDRAREKRVDPGAIEIWFADEARIGQKNKITRRWARRVRCAAASRAVTTENPVQARKPAGQDPGGAFGALRGRKQ